VRPVAVSAYRVAVDGWAGTMSGLEGRKKTDCWGTVPHWDGASDEETTATSGGRDRGCESADSLDAAGGRLLLDPGLTSGFEEWLFVDQEDVRLVTPSLTNDPPEARKDWPGCGWSVDGDDDNVMDGAVEDGDEVVRQRGHERTG
jgi:hypothetical protein